MGHDALTSLAWVGKLPVLIPRHVRILTSFHVCLDVRLLEWADQQASGADRGEHLFDSTRVISEIASHT
jgi:hypothetical protein